MTEEQRARWRAVGGTVAGASHVRAGIPNQDSIHLPASEGPPLVVAVSDGHGSAKCFRSDRGSRFAVAAAVLVMRELLERARGVPAARPLEELARERAPAEIARRWREAVELDLAVSPIAAEELDTLEARDGVTAREFVAGHPLLAYGATVVAAAIDERFIAFVQLGDGDVLVVSESGEVARPMPTDARLFANETTSLSSPSAERDFRVAVRELSEVPRESRPALVLLSTDGYANSFRDEAGFIKVGADLFEMIGASGLDTVARDVPSWLDETSREGSGDDVTLAIICRTDAIRAPAPPKESAAPSPQEKAAGAESPATEQAPAAEPEPGSATVADE